MKKVYRIISTLLIAAMVASSLSVMAAPNGVEQMEEFSETSVETTVESMSVESSEVSETSIQTPAEPMPDEPNQDDTTPDIVDGIIQIDDEQDLNKIGNDANYPLDGNYILTADITMTENFHPIGKDGAPFIGKFYGDGHVIYNLTIEEEGDNVGLFGVASEGAIIENLGVENGIVESTGSNVGGLVGWAAEATIENCYYRGSVSGGISVGGVVGSSGQVGLFGGTAMIKNCYQIGNIEGDNNVGGIVGKICSVYGVSTNVENCYHSGKLECYSNRALADIICGGIATYNSKYLDTGYKFKNNYYDVSTSGEYVNNSYDNPNIKGLTTDQMTGPNALENMPGLEKDYTAAPNDDGYPQLSIFVTDANDPAQFPIYGDDVIMIGSAARLQATRDDDYIQIDSFEDLVNISNDVEGYPLDGHYKLTKDINCYSEDYYCRPIGSEDKPFTGTFDGGGHLLYNVNIETEDDYAGLFGYVKGGTIKNLKVEGNIKGKNKTGGIAGQIVDKAIIDSCCFIGNIEGNNYTGGIVGDCGYPGRISIVCKITNCCQVGSIYGHKFVGGIAGRVNNVGDYKQKTLPKISNCYHTGLITGEYNTTGGLVGELENGQNNQKVVNEIGICDFKNSYYDRELSGVKKAIGGIDSINRVNVKSGDLEKFEGLTTNQMTGPNALDNMTGMSEYTAPPIQTSTNDNGDILYYYPQLSIFVIDQNDINEFPGVYYEDDLITISTVQELQRIGKYDDHPLDGNYTLKNDIDMSGVEYTPIGEEGIGFSGVFDGNGHTISNLKVGVAPEGSGLFAKITGATIENLNIENAHVEGDQRLGCIAGEVDNSQIINCHVTGEVLGNNYVCEDIGGIAGITTNSTIESCSFDGDVKGYEDLGGIAGDISKKSVIKNCAVEGSIKGGKCQSGRIKDIEDEGRCIGSIAGYVDEASITNCYSVCDIKANDDGGGIAGKVVGTNNTIKGCYHTGSIECTKGDKDKHKDNIGGVIGYLKEDFKDNNISNCYYDIDTAGEGAKNKYGNNNSIGVDSKCVEENGDFDDSNVKGLTTEQMTGPNALDNMNGMSKYTAPPIQTSTNDNGDILYYYPQLSIFVNDANDFTQFPAYILLEIVDGVIQIGSPQELQAIGSVANCPLDGKYAMTADIDMSEVENFTPIGSEDKPFTGTFDCNRHTIYGLNIKIEDDYAGLFGCVENGTVKNLKVEGSVKGVDYIGGIAGKISDDSVIENCNFNGQIYGEDCIGSIAGYVDSSSITNCYSVCDIKANDDGGGIAGKVVGTNNTIKGCYHTGSIECTKGDKDKHKDNIGGVIGYLKDKDFEDNNISNCYYDIDTAGEGAKNKYGNNNSIGVDSKCVEENGDFDDSNVKGLTTEQMTGPNALGNMPGLEEAYTAAPNDDGYPQLSIFVTDPSNPDQFPTIAMAE